MFDLIENVTSPLGNGWRSHIIELIMRSSEWGNDSTEHQIDVLANGAFVKAAPAEINRSANVRSLRRGVELLGN